MENVMNLLMGFGTVFSPENLGVCLLGSVLGLIVGAMPGIGSLAGCALLLPLTYKFDPTAAIIMLGALYYSNMYGGAFSAILLNVPGDSPAVMTVLDGHPMATQRADGVIVASATGSTAYAMAAGGPILHPALNTMVLVPVAPHALTNRPIVLPGSSIVDISLIEAREASAYCDMQDFFPMQKGDILRVRTLPQSFTILHPIGHNHYDTLRRKLYWNLMPSDNASLPIKD